MTAQPRSTQVRRPHPQEVARRLRAQAAELEAASSPAKAIWAMLRPATARDIAESLRDAAQLLAPEARER